MTDKPKMTTASNKELDKVQEQFDAFDKEIKELTVDRLNTAPKEESEPMSKLSQKDIEGSKDIYLKPIRAIGSKEKFNEDYREDYNFAREYVRFIPENREIIGETIDLWTKPFAGMPAEEWKVPTGKPVWAPRYVAEQIAKCKYHRLVMQENVAVERNGFGQIYGAMAIDTTVQRLDALPVSTRKSVFMGSGKF